MIVKGLMTIGTNASYSARLNVISDSTANAIYAVGGTTGATRRVTPLLLSAGAATATREEQAAEQAVQRRPERAAAGTGP